MEVNGSTGLLHTTFDAHGPFVEVARGADSKLVQKVAREVSCDQVGFCPDAIVRHASIRGLPSCFADRFRHSHALRTHRSAHAAPIPLADRIDIFRRTLQQRRLGVLRSAMLLALLGAGNLVFRLGGLAAEAARLRAR